MSSVEQFAPWLALAFAVAFVAIVGVTGWRAWRRWRRVSETRAAALALLDVHAERLDAAIALANEHVGGIADDGEQLASSLAELKADAAHLRWMLGRVPEARERLQRELLDLVLPTAGGERRDG